MTMTLSGSGTIAGLVAGGLPDATVTSSDLASNAVDSQTRSLFNATGSAPVYACRAWVNFNGTGTVAIRASGNVSSITDNGTGDYTVNFTNALSNVNYVPNINYSPIYATYYPQGARVFSTGATILESAPTVSGFRFSTGFETGNEQDPKYVLVNVLGN